MHKIAPDNKTNILIRPKKCLLSEVFCKLFSRLPDDVHDDIFENGASVVLDVRF